MKRSPLLPGVAGLAWLLVTALATAAAAPDLNWTKHGPPAWATEADIAAAKQLRALAIHIDNRTETAEGVHWKYEAIARVIRAAGVQDRAPLSPEEKEKVRAMWTRFEERGLLVCNNLQFDVADGSLLKFAVSSLFDPFVYLCADLKLGLTRIDENDGRTVLDYLQYRIDGQSPGPVREQFEIYYRALKKAGAKHRSELP